MIIQSAFRPPLTIRNRHIQTILPFFIKAKNNIPYQKQRLELPDGDFVDVFWCDSQSASEQPTLSNSQPIAIVLHGMGGCFQSHYIPGMIRTLLNQGYRVAFLHARGCSGEVNRLPTTFHAADTSELDFLVQTIMQQHPDAPIAAVGFSLGGSILLKWLAETGNTRLLSAGVALSVPFDLSATAQSLNQGFSQTYQTYLLQNLKSLAIEKLRAHPAPLNTQQIKAIKSLREYDNLMTAPINGFGNVDNYYGIASCRQYLGEIKTPTLILNAVDDPFIPEYSIPESAALSKPVTLELSRHGGHVGFVANIFMPNFRYFNLRASQYLHSHISQYKPAG
ncbi:MAG: hydrolase [Gammaproteobacteria bacterium]